MRTQTTTTLFESSHGKQPRGFGRWGFQGEGQEGTFFHTGTFSQSRRESEKHFSKKGCRTVRVLP